MMSPQTVFFPHHLLLGHWTCSAGADLQGRRNLPHVASSHMIPAFPSVGLSICHCIMFRLWVFCLLFMFSLCGVSVKIVNPMNVFVVIFPDAVQFADLLPQLQCTPLAGKELISCEPSRGKSSQVLSADPDLESCLLPPQFCLKLGFCCTRNICCGQCQKPCPVPYHCHSWALAHCLHQSFQPSQPPPGTCSPGLHPSNLLPTTRSLILSGISWKQKFEAPFFTRVTESCHSKLEFLGSKSLW